MEKSRCIVSDTFVVVVEHNLVTALERVAEGISVEIPHSKLEVGTQLADNNRANGCIDGRYYFDSAQRARIFATLCLEFTKALVEKRLDVLKALATGAEYHA